MLVRFRARVATRLRMTTPSAAFLSSAVGNLLLTSSSVAPATEARTRALSSFLSKAEKGGEKVRLCEVGPRDGLQNETTIVDASVKLELIDRLVKAGLRTIESAAFVSPKWVPQMANSAEVMRSLQGKPHFVSGSVSFPALVPNLKGMDAAIASGTKEIAIFASASESFSRKNINCTIEESLVRFKPVLESAKVNGIKVRGYVSCVIGCPYEGTISPESVARLSEKLLEMGCYEISLGDTIGVGAPRSVHRMLREVGKHAEMDLLAVHFHDTYGQALANILTSLEMGIRVIDSSVAGLGGCPYAKGATGNVATEDVLYMLHDMKVETGVSRELVMEAGAFISKELNKTYEYIAGA